MTGPTSRFHNLDAVTGTDLLSVTFATSRARGRGYDEQQVGSGVGGVTGRLVVVAAVPSDVDGIAGAAATDLLSVVISR